MIAEDGGVSDKWRKARATSGQRFVALPQQIPVRLLYQNVFVESGGDVAFRTDPYGWNAPIAKALGFHHVSRAKAHPYPVDFAP
jgi:murein L,D-transpeptidase YcbB/YkuD